MIRRIPRGLSDFVIRRCLSCFIPAAFGQAIILLVYVPLLALEGVEGKMFRPMALTVMLALGGALVISVTLMPVLCSYLLGGNIREKDNWLVTLTKRIYSPLLNFGLRFRWLVILPMFGLFGLSLVIFSRLGSEFIPQLDEGDFTVQLIRSSSAGQVRLHRVPNSRIHERNREYSPSLLLQYRRPSLCRY